MQVSNPLKQSSEDDHPSDTALHYWCLWHKLLFTINACCADAFFKSHGLIEMSNNVTLHLFL